MNTLYYILFFAAGLAVDILYNRSKRIAVNNAYKEGFKHAKREDEYYRDGVNYGMQYRANEKLPERKLLVPDSFMDEVHENGHATMKIQ